MKLFRLIRPRWKKVLADLWEDKVRTLLVIASISIGVFAVGMIAGSHSIISSDMTIGYISAMPSNIELTISPFDKNFVDSFRQMDSIHIAEGTRKVSVRFRNDKGESVILDLITFMDETPQIKVPGWVSGAEIPAKRQIVLEEKFLEERNIAIGETLQIELEDGTIKDLEVVGINKDMTDPIGGMIGNVKGYISLDSLEYLHEVPLMSTLMFVVNGDVDDKAHIQDVTNQVIDKVEKSGRQVYNVKQREQSKHPLGAIIAAVLGILLLLGVLIVFLSGSLITNTLSSLINQQFRQIGVMKLVGARNQQIIAMYMVLIISFSVIALMIAIPLGGRAAYALSNMAAGMMNFELTGYRIVPFAIILQIVVGLGIPILAGLSPVLKGARITVHKAIQPSGIQSSSVKRGAKKKKRSALLKKIPRPLIISLRNTFRQKRRLLLTIFNLTLGGAIFISVFNVREALNYKMIDIAQYFSADVNISFDRTYRVDEIDMLAHMVPGVDMVEPWLITNAEMLNDIDEVVNNLVILAPPIHTEMVTPIMMEGRWIVPEDQNALVVNEAFLKEFPDFQVGETYNLRVYGQDETWKIVGMFQFTGMEDLYAYSSFEYLSAYQEKPGKASVYRISTIDHSRNGQDAVVRQIDSYFSDRGYILTEIDAGGKTVENTLKYIGVLITILLILAVLTATVGSIGLTGMLSMNVLERTKEIGVLRAIGAYNQVVMQLVIVEGVLISTISYGFSILLSFPITNVLSSVVSQAIFSSPVAFRYTPMGYYIWFGIIIILSIVASILPAKNASQMTIREVLAYE
ncbi:MAG: FtsX-like permease family protein [Anaerolineaceae bacterium]|nr:FtsX-like permease family protein [Anaerolineaceae bacterium]